MHFSRDRFPERASQRRHQLRISGEYAGRWIAWDRDQTRIVASGDSFAAAKEAASAAGESSVLMARIPAHSAMRFGRPLLYMVAVFISHMT
jgi:hypothetical protein